VNEDRVDIPDGPAEPASRTAEQRVRPKSKKLRVLVIDDNSADTDLLRKTLPDRGSVRFRLECVSRLSEALARLEKKNIDLVLLDMELPVSQGLETLGRLQAAAPDVPVIVLTRDGDDEMGVAAVGNGAQDYLVKGRTPGELLVRSVRHAVERKRSLDREHLAREVLSLLNRPEEVTDTVRDILRLIKTSGFEAVGIRLREGDDYPYYVTNGFSEEFLQDERSLCERDEVGAIVRDAAGNPVLACMCGNILQGRTDASLPFFTARGSFWTNNTTRLLASTTEKDLQARNRNRCNGEGYESVAIIPLRSGCEIIGLLQLNDRRPDRFTPEMIRYFEGLGASIGIALAHKRVEQERVVMLSRLEAINLLHQSLLAPAPLDRKLMSITDSIVRLFNADFCRIWLIRPGDLCEQGCLHAAAQEGPHECRFRDRCLHLLASSGRYTHTDGKGHGRVPFDCYKIGRIASGKEQSFFTNDAQSDPRVHDHEWARELGIVSFAGYQICVPGGQTMGVLALFARQPIAPAEDAMLAGLSSTAAMVVQTALVEESRVKLEDQLRSHQKMEAIGSLAGGVAHDFNNQLAVILGYTQLSLEEMREDDPQRDNFLEVEKAGQQAAMLTRQLLAFGRRQVLQPMSLDLNQVLTKLEKMLRRIIGEDIDMVQVLAPDLGLTLADPGQIEQVLMNLVINARDAMPTGGKLTIETANVVLDEEYKARHVSVNPGPHVLLSVTDSGCGMDEQTRARLFEPFFTTKERGKGTGLGLSTVYGIVKQSGGNIWVYSEPGQGTTFKLYFPLQLSAAALGTGIPATVTRVVGTETVLVVEDEEAVRALAERILGAAGYTVLTAANGNEALLTCEAYRGKIHLVLIDVVMPHLCGRALSERLAVVHPGIKVLYTSGYTDSAVLHHGVFDPRTPFISKPWNTVELARKVREVLDDGVVEPANRIDPG